MMDARGCCPSFSPWMDELPGEMFNFRLEWTARSWCSACCGSGLNTALYLRHAACAFRSLGGCQSGQEQNLILPDGSSIRRNMGFSDREWGIGFAKPTLMSISPHPHPSFPLAHPPDTAVHVRAVFRQNEPTNIHHPAAGMKGERRSSEVPKCHLMSKRGWAGYGQLKKKAGAEGVGRETAKGDLDPHRCQETHEKRTMLWMRRRRGANQRPPTQLFAAQRDAMRCSRSGDHFHSAANVLTLFFAAEGVVGLFGSWLCPNKHFGHARCPSDTHFHPA